MRAALVQISGHAAAAAAVSHSGDLRELADRVRLVTELFPELNDAYIEFLASGYVATAEDRARPIRVTSARGRARPGQGPGAHAAPSRALRRAPG